MYRSGGAPLDAVDAALASPVHVCETRRAACDDVKELVINVSDTSARVAQNPSLGKCMQACTPIA